MLHSPDSNNLREPTSLDTCDDQEKNPVSVVTNSFTEWSLEFLKQLFDLPKDVIAGYPGISAYCRHLEDVFQPLNSPLYDPAWSEVQHRYPSAITSCWPRLVAVMSSIVGGTEKDTIDSLWKALKACDGPSTEPVTRGNSSNPYGLFITFAIMCWATASLRPIVPADSDACLELTCATDPYYTTNPPRADVSRCKTRPVLPFFHSFKSCIWESHAETSQTGVQDLDDENLYESGLNYASLHEFGNIRIVWVESLSEHLRFDPVNRQLFLFKFPSFCVLRSLQSSRNSKRSVVQSINAQLDPLRSPGKLSHSLISLDQEVMMSYRLLFGMSARSRKLALVELNQVERLGGALDSLLPALCGQSYKERASLWSPQDISMIQRLPSQVWPASCLDAEGHLQESSIYSARHDFPRFSQRLLYLQRFNLRQKPSKLTDLWRDRRNMVQWYTFWLVTLFGGMGLLLSFLQLVLAFMQLWRSWNE